ncbi:MAG: hypothetical protein K9L74_06135 [Candidatus Izimaplasma sp.]|nr:hypothetical protein [Candidatus Izimaplasma bacterium]
MKKIFGVLILIVVFTLSACSNDTGLLVDDDPIKTDNQTDEQSNILQLTIEELAVYDGTDGNPAYIAVDDVIYDVTGSNRWSDGTHNGFTAGQDLTEQINTISPHGTSVLDGIPVVGEIVND